MRLRHALISSGTALALAHSAQAEGLAQSEAEHGVDAMLDYVLPLALQERQSRPHQSALLSDPSSLDGARASCTMSEPTIVLDVDPADGPAALDQSIDAPKNLIEAVSYLRTNGVSLVWISDHLHEAEPALRRALATSRLDPSGKDLLVLKRAPEDRKQTRRQALAKSHCVLAIGGDDMSDFDELFDYLKNPADASELTSILGAGWFLLPQPLIQS